MTFSSHADNVQTISPFLPTLLSACLVLLGSEHYKQQSDIPMAPRSLDITPCGFFLWGFVKDKVYVPPLPHNLEDLRICIANALNLVTHAETSVGRNGPSSGRCPRDSIKSYRTLIMS
ncbi:hypothetical protein AVEN_175940-1 [Araneus ventricosus]|uniref:Uncharacterized protein n=1 Tax=Araneus ventricosus TaxID=182803 RepID=A0A4Y2PFV4_ARAVE|nr:hypothetical protein AVEN_175940-1 [Araneus ventricosus]